MNKNLSVVLIISVALFIISFLICWQIKTVENSDNSIIQLQRENTLRDELLKWQENYNSVSEQLKQKEAALEEYLKNASNTNNTIALLQKELAEINVVAGLTEVKNTGIILTVKDAEQYNPLYLVEDQIVHDTDLLQIVNELRAAGAEAISINNQRLTSLTAIRCVGPTILVNDVRIGSPFIVKAVGNVDYLYSAMNLSGGVVDILKKYGMVIEIEKNDEVVIPKYEGTIKITH